MGISGSLKDVSVADVMQFIHLGRRTGTLLLSRGGERAMIGFHGGRLVSAQAPHTPKLGDLLISSGMIDGGVLAAAIRSQNEELERRSLGQILVSSGSIDAQGLRQMIAEQIEQAVSEVMIWETGTFEFAIDDLRPIDDIALYPSDVLPDADINTQMVLLEAARIFDERNRDGTHPALPAGSPAPHAHPEPRQRSFSSGDGTYEAGDSTHPTLNDTAAGGALALSAGGAVDPAETAEPALWAEAALREAPTHAAERLRLQIVSADIGFGEQLAEALQDEVAGTELVPIDQAGNAEPGEPPPIVLLDLRRGGVTLEEAGPLRRACPRASFIALVEPGTPFARVYEVGMMAALPAEVEAVVACVENVIESRRDLVRGTPRPDTKSGVARLRRVFGDLRSGLISATVALNLMHIISESVERAVLFLVKRDHLVALGAFGSDPKGRPLAEVTRGLKVPLDLGSALAHSLDTGEVQSITFDEAELPNPFRSMVGPPKNGLVVIFPVLGAQRVISVIYTDNGDSEKPIEDIDILELATAQVGMAFENELLRRQISQGK
jgi:hypothetical protein